MALADQMAPASQAPQQAQPQTQQDFAQLHGSWMDYLRNPQTQAALLQFAASVVQPVNRGESVIGQFGNALADAGQAAGRVGAAQAQQEQQYIKDAQTQQALESEDRARAATAASEQERNRLAGKELEQKGSQFEEDMKTKWAQLGIEQKKADAYVKYMGLGQGGGGSTRDKLISNLFSTVMKAQQDASLTGDTVDTDKLWTGGMTIIDKYAPEAGHALPAGAVPTGGSPQPTVTPDQARALWADPTKRAQIQADPNMMAEMEAAVPGITKPAAAAPVAAPPPAPAPPAPIHPAPQQPPAITLTPGAQAAVDAVTATAPAMSPNLPPGGRMSNGIYTMPNGDQYDPMTGKKLGP